MNRGRRRGGVSSGFGSLRDGVKRRLFDPHAVPTLPDPQSIISRLTPLSTSQPQIDTVLPILDGQSTSNELPATKKFQNDLVCMEYDFYFFCVTTCSTLNVVQCIFHDFTIICFIFYYYIW